MKIKIGFFILFSCICALNAYAQTSRDWPIQKDPESAYTQHIRIVNQQMDQAEGIVPLQNAQQGSPVPIVLKERVHTFNINAQTFYSHYSESQKAKSITGVWNGVEGQYIFRPPKRNFLNTPVFNYYAFEGLYARGNNKLYRTEILSSDNSITKLGIRDIPGYLFETRFLLGKDFISLPSFHLTPYTGFGIRYMTNHSAGHYDIYAYDQGTPNVALGHNFSDFYYYMPYGLTFDLATSNDYEVSLNIEYDSLLKGYERDDYANFDEFTLPQDGYTNQNLRFTFNHGWGFRSSLKFLKHLSSVDIYLQPYMRYWHINASQVASGSVLGGDFTATANKNTTIEAGSSLGVQF